MSRKAIRRSQRKFGIKSKEVFSGSNVNKQRRCDDWSPLFVAAMLGRVEVNIVKILAHSNYHQTWLLIIKGGAAPGSGGGRHQTNRLGGEDSRHGECQPIRSLLKANQKHCHVNWNERFQVARQYGHHMVADIINSPRDKHRPTFPTQFMDFLKASAGDEACVILWDEHLE